MRLSSAVLTAAALVAILAPARPAAAHQGHHASPSPSPSASPAATVTSPAATATTAPPSPAAAAPVPWAGPAHIDWREAAFEHLHNKLVHFPIALGLAAAVIFLVSPRWPQYDAAGRALLLVAALFSIAAYFTGEGQRGPFRATPLWELAERHEQLGIVTAIVLGVGVVLSHLRAVKRWMWLYAIVVILIIAATGFVGGVLAHTDL
jgi:uncharacterized membrane protein